MAAVISSPYKLQWVGASGDCSGLPMNGQVVVGGSKLLVGMSHRHLSLGERPVEIHIYERIERLVRRLLGRGPQRPEITALPLHPSTSGEFVTTYKSMA